MSVLFGLAFHSRLAYAQLKITAKTMCDRIPQLILPCAEIVYELLWRVYLRVFRPNTELWLNGEMFAMSHNWLDLRVKWICVRVCVCLCCLK